jgi:hypothetical protein
LKFRRAKERKAAIQLDYAFQGLDSENNYWTKREHSKPLDGLWKDGLNSLQTRSPQSIVSRVSSRFSHQSAQSHPGKRQP